MLSSRPYYGNEVEFYRRSEGGLRLPLGQNSPLVDHYDTASQLSRRTTPSSDADKSGVAPRKRVPVACERCRKRKIKCSGDQGGGCTNCAQAGITNCQFLRVASIGATDLVQRSMYGRAGYPTRYSPYPYSSLCRYNHTTSQASYGSPAPSTYSNMRNSVEYHPYNGPTQGVSWSRSGSYSNSYSPYEAEPTSPYTTQPPSFILPNNDPMSNVNPYLVSSYTNKTQSTQGWPDQGVSIPHPQSNSQIMAAGYAMPTSDSVMTYHNSQSSSNNAYKSDQFMPYPTLTSQQPSALANDRTLPTPEIRNYSSSTHTVSTLDSLPLSALSHRSSLGWQTDASSSSSHISSQTSCSSAGSSQDFSTTDRTSALDRDSQDLSYSSYLGYTTNPQQTLQPNALSTIINNDPQQSSHPALPTNVQSELTSQRCRTISQESSNSSHHPHYHQDSPSATASSSYGYTGASVTRNSHSRNAGAGQLSNGATYTRAQPSHNIGSGGTGTRSRETNGSEDCSGNDCSGCQASGNGPEVGGVVGLDGY